MLVANVQNNPMMNCAARNLQISSYETTGIYHSNIYFSSFYMTKFFIIKICINAPLIKYRSKLRTSVPVPRIEESTIRFHNVIRL